MTNYHEPLSNADFREITGDREKTRAYLVAQACDADRRNRHNARGLIIFNGELKRWEHGIAYRGADE